MAKTYPKWILYRTGGATIDETKFSGKWSDYDVRPAPLASLYHVICHKDTGTIISQPERGNETERFLCFRQFEEHLKTTEDVFRFLNMVQTLFPREIRTTHARDEIERGDRFQKPKLLDMLATLVDQKNICTSPFKTCTYNLTPDFEKKMGRDWMANFKHYPATRAEFPTVSLAEFKRAAKRNYWDIKDKPAHIKACPGSNPSLGTAFRIKEMPYTTFFASYRHNGGESLWDPDNQRKHIYVLQKYQCPKNYTKVGCYYFQRNRCWEQDTPEDLYLAEQPQGKRSIMQDVLHNESSAMDVFELNRPTLLGHEKGYTPNFRLATAEEVMKFKAEHVLSALTYGEKIPVLI